MVSGLLDQGLQCVKVDILKFIDVKTGFASLIFSKLVEQMIVSRETRHDIESEILFPG